MLVCVQTLFYFILFYFFLANGRENTNAIEKTFLSHEVIDCPKYKNIAIKTRIYEFDHTENEKEKHLRPYVYAYAGIKSPTFDNSPELFLIISLFVLKILGAIILTFSITCWASFADLFDWKEELNYYIPNIPIILCGLKIDARNNSGFFYSDIILSYLPFSNYIYFTR